MPVTLRERMKDGDRAFVETFPRLHHLHTLYGEAVGAAVERRLRIIAG